MAGLVVADLVGRAPIAGNAATVLALLHEAGHDALEFDVKGDRLQFGRFQPDADALQGLQHLVAQRADIDRVRGTRQFTAGLHCPLLDAA